MEPNDEPKIAVVVPQSGPRKLTKLERMSMNAYALRSAIASGDRERVEDALRPYGFDEEQRRRNMAIVLLSICKERPAGPPAEEPEWPKLNERDAELIGQMSEGLMPAETGLLMAMARCARARPHPTGRIRYEDAELMRESRIKSKKEYRAAFASLGEKGLVKVAVVGSKNPVMTIELPWLPKEDDGSCS